MQYYRGDKTWQSLDSSAVGIFSATGEAAGLIYLAGDLSGTAKMPTVNKVGGISALTIATFPTSIASNTSSITTNTGDIATNRGNITTNTSDIVTNRANITTNTNAIAANTSDILLKAPLASPALTGVPTAPTASTGTSSTQLANTAFVVASIISSAAPSADGTTLGKIQLAGDLTGSANSPRIGIGAINTSKILDLNVTNAKIESINGEKVIGDINGKSENVTGVINILHGGTGVTTINDMKQTFGIDHIDNISDMDKPVSTDMQIALNLKSPINSPVFTGTVGGITKDMIGLANINNTSDLNKPLSSASITELALKEYVSNKSSSTSLGSSNLLFPTQNAVKTYVDLEISNSLVPSATALLLGKIKLGGDLNGTGSSADAPIISNLVITTNKIADASVTDQKIVSMSASKLLGNISGNAVNMTGILSIANGGTGATNASNAKLALGLENVNNISDANKEISAATNIALGLKANLVSPNFTGTVSAPNFTGNLSGNSSTANSLNTARTINGINFDGSSNIIVPDNTRILLSEKAANNGVATLDGSGKVLISQLPVGAQSFKGTWNAATNTPTLTDGSGTAGWTYIVSNAGTQNLGSQSILFNAGDNVIYNGAVWQQTPNTSSVISVNNQQGVIILSSSDIAEGSNSYFTNARSRTSISATSPVFYNNLTGAISSQPASISQSGYLSSSDWSTFNSKQEAGNFITPSSAETLTNKTLTNPVINAPSGITKNDIGLPNVNNTSDALKSVLSASKLTTSITINGTLFDGSANINISDPSKISSSEKASINGVATLDGFGKIPANQMTSIAISNTFVIASEVDMLALTTAQRGDIAIRSDIHTSLILTALPYSNLSNWQELLTPLATVQTVNGKQGVVTLNSGEIQEGSNLYYTDARVAGKEATIISGTNSQYFRGDKTWQTLNANTIGLANVDNTADYNKSVFAATKLTTPRKINEIIFDGTEDITITATTNDATSTIKGRILLGGDLNGVGSSSLTPIISLAAISNEKVADNAISTSKILDENITESKIANLAVTDAKIQTISGSKIIGNISGKAANVTTNANLNGDVQSIGNTTTVTKLNGVSLSALSTGIIKNNTSTGFPTIAVAGTDFEFPITAGTNSQYWRGDKTWQTLNSTVVGLANVNNTSDIDKPLSTATSAYVLANADRYNSISAGNEISTTSTTDVLATGMSFTPTAGKYIVNFNSEYSIVPGDRTGQAQIDLNAAYLNLMSKTVTNSTHAAGYGAGETLSPGVYYNGGAVTTTGTLTLDAGGNPNAEFVFQIGAAFSTGAGFTVILANGASACNVYFIAEGAIALGANTVMKGMLLSNSGAVSLGSLSNVQGNLFSSAGSIGLDASTVNTLTGCANNFGTINNFAIFSKSGIISNAGASSITGDIASNTGTVSGFESATLNGSIYASGASNATANFSVYQNGILIPFSSRKRKSTLNLGEINLQALATISSSGSIEIRWNIDLGTVKMQNRILTIQQVR